MNKEEYSKYIDNIKNMSKEELEDYILQYFETLKVHHNIEDKLQQTINKQKEVLDKIKPMLKELNIKLKDILNIGIDIKEISDILELLEEIE